MKRKPTIAIVGAGSLALALAPALRAAGYKIDQVASRNTPPSGRRAGALARKLSASAATVPTLRLEAGLIWLCVPDGAIRDCAKQLARGVQGLKGATVFHSSGALSSDELAPLRAHGARVASVHPMMTFVRRAAPSLHGVGFALEGDAAAVQLARRIVRDLGGHAFTIRKQAKPLYHAWGAFASPVIIMELALAERIARAAGLPEREARKSFEPIVRQTIDNYFRHGAAAAFSGPLVRGDVDTVRRHVQQLARIPGAREVYRALAKTALTNLPVGRRKEMEKLLK